MARTGQAERFEDYAAFEDRWYEVGVYRSGQDSVAILSQDITERKRAEDQLRQAERTKSRLSDRLSESQRLARIGSWEWDLQTNDVWWSEEIYRIFGVSPTEYVPDFEANGRFIHPEDYETYAQAFDQALRSGEPLDFDVRLITADGSPEVL